MDIVLSKVWTLVIESGPLYPKSVALSKTRGRCNCCEINHIVIEVEFQIVPLAPHLDTARRSRKPRPSRPALRAASAAASRHQESAREGLGLFALLGWPDVSNANP